MNTLDLKGRVAVITGGAQGIGYATSERMLRSGASVVMWDIDAGKLEEAKASLGKLGKVSGYVVELTSDAAVGATTAQTIKDSGHIDILVNNAGITGGNGTTWDLDPEVWKRVIDVNLMAPYYTCRHITPHMVSRGWGRIVNIASVAGKEGNPNASHYSASKAGVIALTKSLAKEVATKGVLVNAVAQKQADKAFKIVQYFEYNPKAGELVVIVPALFKLFSQLMRVHFTPNKSREAIASSVGVHPFVAGELLANRQNYDPKKIAAIIALLHEYDLKAKGVGNSQMDSSELLKEMIFQILYA